MNPLIEAAEEYVRRGWRVVPVLPQGKAPGWGGKPRGEWQKLRLGLEELPRYFGAPSNIGVLLGEPSGWLADVDLDAPESLELAPLILLDTWTFGRHSKPESHWLYVAKGARTAKHLGMSEMVDGKRFAPTLVELRAANADGTGSSGQTVFPPSIHVSGEAVKWSPDSGDRGGPREIDAGLLSAQVLRLAQATLLARASGIEVAKAWLTRRGRYDAPPAVRQKCLEMEGRWPSVRESAPAPAATGAVTDLTAAVATFNSAHRLEWPKSGGSCPICGHHECFGGVRGSQERWSCFSASHPEVGVRGEGCWTGDALDVEAHRSGMSRTDLLKREGYLR